MRGGDGVRRHLVIVGPTASGKSALAMALARPRPDVEIVSVDSMCVYRHMDIGTAKPSADDRAAVAHHLIDVIGPDESFSVGRFQREALAVMADLDARGRRAVLVGGTGLYHRAVVDGLDLPGRWPQIVAALDPDRDDPADTAALHRRLVALDPVAAARIEPGNRRRLVRALEVTLGSGRTFSSFGPGLVEYPASPYRMIGLTVPRDRLAALIGARVDVMLARGLVEETRSLVERFTLSPTARQALGYSDVLVRLDTGSLEPPGSGSDAELRDSIVTRTRRFAVRQDRWFRRDPRIEWFPHDQPDLAERLGEILDG